jgi:hypothetical protein
MTRVLAHWQLVFDFANDSQNFSNRFEALETKIEALETKIPELAIFVQSVENQQRLITQALPPAIQSTLGVVEPLNPESRDVVQIYKGDDINSSINTHQSHLSITETLDVESSSLGFEAVLSGMITGAWTAFEVLAEDLWKAAVDRKPDAMLKKFAKQMTLGGERKVDVITIPFRVEDFDKSGYQVDGRFTLQGRVSDFLQHEVNLTTILGIASAFEHAFASTTFDSLDFKKNRSLFDLAKTRNVIVHSAAEVDTEFYKNMVNIATVRKQFAGLSVGDPVSMDGELVEDLITGSVLAVTALLKDVDAML